MNTKDIDFSLVSQIAYEKLGDGDPDKALGFVLECVPGMPEDLALQIVTGHAWLEPGDNGMVNFTITRPEGYFKTPDMLWLLQHRMDDMRDTLRCMLEKMAELKYLAYIENITMDDCLVSDVKYARSMMKDNPSSSAEEWYCDIWDNVLTHKAARILAHVVYLYKNMQYFIRDYKKSYKLWSWGRTVLHIHPVKDAMFFQVIGKLLSDFNRIAIEDRVIMKSIRAMKKDWLSIMKDDDVLMKAFTGELLECDIMDGYDAGWLSPEGIFYGADGPTSALIHINIANELGYDDVELEREGWIKVHHDTCYSYPKFFKDLDCLFTLKNPDGSPWNGYVWSKNQLEVICNYIDKFYNGKLCTGPTYPDYLTTTKLKSMDIIALHNALEH